MMGRRSFSWKALDQEGRIHRGSLEVSRASDVRNQLFAQGYFPLQIHPRRSVFAALAYYWDYWQKKSDWLRVWAGLSRWLAFLLRSGIPLLQALEILSEQDRHSRLYVSWIQVQEKLEAGADFSEAVQALIPPPTPYLRAMIQAGEQAGRLPEVLEQIAQELEEEYTFRRKLTGAYAYPVFLLLLSMGVIYGISVFILPVYEGIFLNLEAQLPILTQVIFGVAKRIPWAGGFFLLVILTTLLFLRLRHGVAWKEKLHDALGRLPLFGRIYRLNDCLQFSQALGTLLEAGIPLMEALNLTRGAVRSYPMKEMVGQLGAAAREGRRLAPILRLNPGFPGDAAHMLKIGEESGQLSMMLINAAKMFRMELEEQMEKLPQILGPFLVILLSGIIGLVAVGVLLPVFDIGTHLQ